MSMITKEDFDKLHQQINSLEEKIDASTKNTGSQVLSIDPEQFKSLILVLSGNGDFAVSHEDNKNSSESKEAAKDDLPITFYKEAKNIIEQYHSIKGKDIPVFYGCLKALNMINLEHSNLTDAQLLLVESISNIKTLLNTALISDLSLCSSLSIALSCNQTACNNLAFSEQRTMFIPVLDIDRIMSQYKDFLDEKTVAAIRFYQEWYNKLHE